VIEQAGAANCLSGEMNFEGNGGRHMSAGGEKKGLGLCFTSCFLSKGLYLICEIKHIAN